MFLSILLWAVIAWLAFSVLVVIGAVGKPRKPLTSGTAIASVVIYGGIITVLAVAALEVAS